MKILDQKGIPWTKAHGIRLPYTSPDGSSRHYVPDFLVEYPGGTCLEEVKGQEGRDLHQKIVVAEAYCRERGWTFRLLGTLKALGA